jgi:hypothetical protein
VSDGVTNEDDAPAIRLRPSGKAPKSLFVDKLRGVPAPDHLGWGRFEPEVVGVSVDERIRHAVEPECDLSDAKRNKKDDAHRQEPKDANLDASCGRIRGLGHSSLRIMNIVTLYERMQ